ncbi:MAG: S26 family signal peptidase [Bacillota bacterium]|nr:S26 family signal peptidase [Bacillota bacterium]
MNKRAYLSDFIPVMRDVLKKDGEVIFTITGNSMAPMLRHRKDKVCIKSIDVHDLKKYDIPLFVRKDGKYILHRIVGIKEDGFEVMGDNQFNKEYPVNPSQVIGVVNGFWKDDKYISCDSFKYKMYSKAWVFIYPIRWFYLRIIK